MKVEFSTKNIDTAFYRQIIYKYIASCLSDNRVAWAQYKKMRSQWKIQILPTSDWKFIDMRVSNTGTLNGMIPHGVTGEGIVKAYVIDVDDKGLTSLQNFSAILHEVAHMILIILMRGKRGTFRNADMSGNQPGAKANVSTQEVHDRQMERNFYQLKAYVNMGNWIFRKWVRYSVIAIELRDFIKKTVF